MKALVKYRKGDGFVKIKEVVTPRLERGEVLLKVKATGICGTDIHVLHDEFKNYPPVILGHEFSAEIARTGEGVSGWKAGERVVSELHKKACGLCHLCRTGKAHICPKKRSMGSGTDGAFTKYVKVPAWLLHRIPKGVSYELAAVTEPLAICVHGVLEEAGVEPEDFVVVLGPGPIGLLAAQVAKAVGAAQVLITGTSKDEKIRLKAARKLGIEYIINVEKEDLIKRVQDLTHGHGADLVVEATGVPVAIGQAFEVVRRGGRISAIGLSKEENIAIPWNKGVMKEIGIFCSFSSSYTSWERALSLVSRGEVNVEPLITHKFPLSQWKKAFEMVEKGKAIKILLIPE